MTRVRELCCTSYSMLQLLLQGVMYIAHECANLGELTCARARCQFCGCLNATIPLEKLIQNDNRHGEPKHNQPFVGIKPRSVENLLRAGGEPNTSQHMNASEQKKIITHSPCRESHEHSHARKVSRLRNEGRRTASQLQPRKGFAKGATGTWMHSPTKNSEHSAFRS